MIPKIALIGAGYMGRGVFLQSVMTGRFDCPLVCDIRPEPFLKFLNTRGIAYALVQNSLELKNALTKGTLAVCSDVRLITDCQSIDGVVDATGDVREAVTFCADILKNRKHLIMVNSEADLMFGPYFAELARENKVVYTSCDGDQYGVLKRMIEEIKLWGFKIVMAGNMKGFLNRYANETTIAGEADKRCFDHKMTACFTDGTKLNIEMALIANSEGYCTKKTGMFGPRVSHVREVLTAFDLPELWKDQKTFVDYILGAEPNGGVYVVGHAEDPYQQEVLRTYKMGDGPFYVFYRPYHLCFFESTGTILDAIVNKKALMHPRRPLTTNVYAYAKKDLIPGDILDGPGGFTCYGLIENISDQKDTEGLPVCLADEVLVKKAIKKDSKIRLSDVEYDPERSDYAGYYKKTLEPTAVKATTEDKKCLL
jgi:predicted homoserine dehydrogenase-like protein